MPNLTPLSFEILLCLVEEPLHGYGIIKAIEARSGEAETPSTGALYLALQRLEGEGLIREADDVAPGADARRRYWALTERGRAETAAEAARLARLVGDAVDKRLLPASALRSGDA